MNYTNINIQGIPRGIRFDGDIDSAVGMINEALSQFCVHPTSSNSVYLKLSTYVAEGKIFSKCITARGLEPSQIKRTIELFILTNTIHNNASS